MKIKYDGNGNNSNGKMKIFEFEPSIRTIKHLNGGFYRISFPYCIFVCHLVDMTYCYKSPKWSCWFQFFCRKEPLKSLRDSLYLFELPPMTTSGYMCATQVIADTEQAAIEGAIRGFWMSSFSYRSAYLESGLPRPSDCTYTLFGATAKAYACGADLLQYWADKTKVNPLYWKDHPFPLAVSPSIGTSFGLSEFDWKD